MPTSGNIRVYSHSCAAYCSVRKETILCHILLLLTQPYGLKKGETKQQKDVVAVR